MSTQRREYETQHTDETMQTLHEENSKRHAETTKNVINGGFPKNTKHPKLKNADEYGGLPHPIWSQEEMKNIELTHYQPKTITEYLAFWTIAYIRFVNDLLSGWIFGRLFGWFNFGENNWLLRICLYESIGNLPGSMFAMVRHLKAIRHIRRDYGWIHSMLLEADNERVHLLLSLNLYKPGIFFRYFTIVKEFLFGNFLFLAYLISPEYCHRFAGYLEEAALTLYTQLMQDLDKKRLPIFERECLPFAREYYQLSNNAKWSDVFMNIRCDEAYHRDVHHTLAPLSCKKEAKNPFANEKYHPY